jgi:Lar family restriction alleviation protein
MSGLRLVTGGTVSTTTALECPHCASDDLAVIEIEDDPVAFAVRCSECGATGPVSLSDDPAHAVFAWNQRMGRLSVVK